MECGWNPGPATHQQHDLYTGQLLSHLWGEDTAPLSEWYCLKQVKNLSINVVLRAGCILNSVSMNVHLRVLLPSMISHLYLEQERAEGVGRLLEANAHIDTLTVYG